MGVRIELQKTRKPGENPLRVQGICEEAQMLKKRASDKTLILNPIRWERWRIRLEEDLIDQVQEETQGSLGLDVAIGKEDAAAVRKCDVM